MNEEDTANIVSEIVTYPQGATLAWGDTHKLIHDTYHSASWVDVKIPEICEKLQYGWLVTILNTENLDIEEEKPWPTYPQSPVIALEPDHTLWSVWDKQTMWHNEELLVVKNYKETPNQNEFEQLEKLADKTGGTIVETPLWSEEAINNILYEWTVAQTGRSDINYVFDNDIGLDIVKKLEERIENEETYSIAENIEVTGSAFQQLLDMPSEEAAELVKTLQDAVKHLKNKNE